MLEFLFANAITTVHLSWLGKEWVLWASEEFGFITPSDSVSTGSSIMPQKKNPDPMELVRGKSARVIGDLVTLLTLCKGLPHAYDCNLQVAKELKNSLPFSHFACLVFPCVPAFICFLSSLFYLWDSLKTFVSRCRRQRTNIWHH